MLAGWLFFFLLLHYNNIDSPWDRDEGEYAYSAWLMEQGRLPYVDSFLLKPPLIVYTYYLSNKIGPDAYWPPRLFGALFTFLTIVLISMIVKKEFGDTTAQAAFFLGPPMLLMPDLTSFAANTEKFMLLPLVGVFALYIWNRNSNKYWPWLLAGILSGVAILYKQIALPLLLTISVGWCYTDFKINHAAKTLGYKISLALAGLTGIIIISLLPITLYGGWSAMAECLITFTRNYAITATQSKTGFFMFFPIFLKNWWLIIFLSVVAVVFAFKKIRFIFLLFSIALLTVYTSQIGHYYILIMPFWIILAAVGVNVIWGKIPSLKIQWERAIILATLTSIIFVLYWPIREKFFYSSNDYCKYLYSVENPFVESRFVANKIREITKQDDRIFIAGSESQIYYYAKRISSSRFNITYPLNINTPLRETYQRQVTSDLERFPPAAIAVIISNYSHLWKPDSPTIFIDYIQSQLERNYRLIGGFIRDQNGNEHWNSNLTEHNRQDAYLLLYKRKESQRSEVLFHGEIMKTHLVAPG